MLILDDNGRVCKAESLEIITDTGEILSDKKPNGSERPWKRHKGNAMKLLDLYSKALKLDETCISEKRLESLRECGDYLLFDVNSTGEKRLRGACFCRLRTCPMCNWRKSLKLYGQVSKIVELLLKERPSTRFIFATLTLKNCRSEDLTETLDRLNQGFKYLTAKSQTFAPAAVFKRSLLGYMKALEITYNSKSKTYHPHIHCIFAVKASYFSRDYIRQSDWVELWRQCTKIDYLPMVDVRAIKGDTAGAVAEVAKYPVKMDELANVGDEAIPALIVFSHVLRKRRLVTFGGLMADVKRRLALDDIENGDLINLDKPEQGFQAVAMVLYKWRVGAYIC